jgi:predicted metal-binding membrane protein
MSSVDQFERIGRRIDRPPGLRPALSLVGYAGAWIAYALVATCLVVLGYAVCLTATVVATALLRAVGSGLVPSGLTQVELAGALIVAVVVLSLLVAAVRRRPSLAPPQRRRA